MLALPPTEEGFVRGRFLTRPNGDAIGGFDVDGRMVASAALSKTETPKAYVASAVGAVHPEARGRGIGTALLGWIEAEALRLLPDEPAGKQRILDVSAESLTDGAERLFADHGFEVLFVEAVMRLELSRAGFATSLPEGVTLQVWTPTRADRFFEAYAASFADRPGFPGWDEEMWIQWATADDGFSSDASFIAVAGDEPIGFIVCAREWITQVGVQPAWRRRGVGSTLVNAALSEFRDAGARQVLLDVNTNNPAAVRFYERLGLRGRFARILFEKNEGV